MSFLAELKRRKVFRVAVAYGAGAWLLVQVADVMEANLVERLVWLDGLATGTIYLLVVGFPIALVLSWLFDWTALGLVRDTGGTESSPSPAAAGGRRAEAVADEGARRSLGEIIASGPLSASRLLRLAVRISETMANAHDNDDVYGALRPADIAVMPDDRIEISALGSAGRTSPSVLAEAAAYTAPECARGDAPDFRSDQFAFGAILYEMATGRRAFVGADRDETLEAIVHADPAPASRFNVEIPMPLQWTIDRCLSKSPEQRYASPRELCADLRAIAETLAEATSARFAPKHNLPATRTPLIGRETELGEIEKLVLDPAIRLVTLSGAGGIGKTRLLVELGRKLIDHFGGGVFFVPLARVQDPDFVASEIGKALHVTQISGRSSEDALYTHIRHSCVRPTLVLIDNFEHVLEAASTVANMLEASEMVKLVVTSRAALRVYGEHEYHVQPLVLADPNAPLEALADYPAVRLFLDRAASLPEHLGEEELRIVVDICARLDGLPLAIELAAARTKVLPLRSLLERIRDPLKLLSSGPRDLPARQRTLRATLEWSYDLLEEDQRKLFRRSGVFVGGATLEAIEAVCNVDEDLVVDPIEAVESLVDNSLLRALEVEGSEPRFAMLETMREYALLQLAEAGEEARTRKAHAAYCLVLAEEASYAQAMTHWEALYDRFDRESGNLHAALDWLIETGDGDWGLKLAQWLGHYWIKRGRQFEEYERMLKLLPLIEEDSGERASALAWAGDLAGNSGLPREARQHYSDSLEVAERIGDLPCVLRNLNGFAVNMRETGDMGGARVYHEKAVSVAREQGAPPAVLGAMLSNYADYAMRTGDLDLAQRLHEETSELFTKVGDEAALAWSLNRLGDVAYRRADPEAARSAYDASLAKFRKLGDKAGMAGCLYDIASLVADSGNIAEAEKLNREALSMYRDLGQVADFPRVLEALCRCALDAGEPGRALTLAGGAAALRQTLRVAIRDSARENIDHWLDAARRELTDAEATTRWMSGWRMLPDQAVAFALRQERRTSAMGTDA